MSFVEWLAGKKTYLAAVAGIVIALGGAYLGLLSTDTAVELVVGGLVAMGLRSGLNTAFARALVQRAAEEGAQRRAAAPRPDTRREVGGGW